MLKPEILVVVVTKDNPALLENLFNSINKYNANWEYKVLLIDHQSTSIEQRKLFELTVKKGISVRELENLVQSKSKGGTRRAKTQKAVDHEVVALEEDLQRALGTKVRVIPQKKRGKIVIEYYSLDDLDRIISLIKK